MDELKTDIALIKSDIKQINKFFGRVETSLEIVAQLQQQVAVQAEQLKFQGDKLEDVEDICTSYKKEEAVRLNVLSDRLEEYRRMAREDHQRLSDASANKRNESNKEILEKLDQMERSLHERITQQTKRINALENWRYYMMGVGAVLLFLVAKLNWPQLFS
jgi:translation elongation factor EF-G